MISLVADCSQLPSHTIWCLDHLWEMNGNKLIKWTGMWKILCCSMQQESCVRQWGKKEPKSVSCIYALKEAVFLEKSSVRSLSSLHKTCERQRPKLTQHQMDVWSQTHTVDLSSERVLSDSVRCCKAILMSSMIYSRRRKRVYLL